ncbi:carbohydrate ABC transporter permease [Luteimicrobium sp. NPDC057192]|uniref:carbohydrate ABC transporter permease n=1 Tax=Luteimicrobium sp. NPDC057192 TaxID=3346042 RepID=UPI00363EA068
MTTASTSAPVGVVDEPAASAPPRRRRPRRRRTGSTIIAIIASIVWVFPVYWMVITAFKPSGDVLSATPEFLPQHPTLDNFVAALSKSGFLTNFKNSVIVVGATLIVSIAIAFFASAALSRFRFRGRRTILIAILVVQMLPGTALLIPQFLVFNQIDLLGTYIGLILAYVGAVLPFSIWVMRGFFVAIPKELEEAAAVDGANTWTILWRVLFPLVAPGVIATSVFAFVTAWNEYLTAYVFMKDQSMYTLPVWLVSFTNPNGVTDYASQMAASTIFSIPVVVFFMIIQRKLVVGMSAGAVKG